MHGSEIQRPGVQRATTQSTPSSGIDLNDKTSDIFKCYVCERLYRWNDEISGKTIECKCGARVRCPELHGDTMTAGKSLDDTVADVVLDEVFDRLDQDPSLDEAALVDEQEAVHLSKVTRHRGVFGLSLGGELLFFLATSIIGLAFTLLCFVTIIWEKENARRFWPYLVVALAVGPISWKLLANRWRLYRRGRSLPQVVADLFADDMSEA